MNENPLCPECGNPVPADSQHQLCPACLMAQAFASRTLDGEPSPSVSPPSPGEIAGRFPQFEILECLGRGGMGVVYKARQKSLNRLVAIKILAPERGHDARFAERFAREAELLAQLSHPHIVTIHDFGETDGLYFLVMEFVDGVNLRDVLRDGKLESKQALAIVPPVCEALQYAHDKGIVHRDIKPENLLLDRAGRIKIADFGIASLIGADGEKSGTPPYMAPEQSRASSEVDHRADIYALGVVFYEMLTGERPSRDFVAPTKRVSIDVRIDEMVLRALEKDPEKRYQTAGDFRNVVETVSAPPAARPPAASRLSLTALMGACAGPMFLAMTFPDARRQKLLLVLAITFVLGWVAVWQIRRSAGKIHGMRLAVFDGLLLPLLVLDLLIGVLIHKAGVAFQWWTQNHMDEGKVRLILLTAAFSLIADLLIVRAVWRAANPSSSAKSVVQAGPRWNPAVMLACGIAGALAFIVFFSTTRWNMPPQAIKEPVAVPVIVRDGKSDLPGAGEYEPPELPADSLLLATVRIIEIPDGVDLSELIDPAARLGDKRLRVLGVLRSVLARDQEGVIPLPWVPGRKYERGGLVPRDGWLYIRAGLRDSVVEYDLDSLWRPYEGQSPPPVRKSIGPPANRSWPPGCAGGTGAAFRKEATHPDFIRREAVGFSIRSAGTCDWRLRLWSGDGAGGQ